jgi:Rod binding domain-containing protein
MQLSAIDHLDSGSASTRARGALQRDFDKLLAGQSATAQVSGGAGSLTSAEAKQLRQATEQMVASAFILPMLQQIRQDPFKSDLFHGGQGEEMFGQLLDTQLADRIVKRTNFPLVESLYNEMARRVTGVSPTRLDTHG